jgi:hypothetical protein
LNIESVRSLFVIDHNKREFMTRFHIALGRPSHCQSALDCQDDNDNREPNIGCACFPG